MSDDFESAAQHSMYLIASTGRFCTQFSWLKFGYGKTALSRIVHPQVILYAARTESMNRFVGLTNQNLEVDHEEMVR